MEPEVKVETPPGGEIPVPGAVIADPPPAQADLPAIEPQDKGGVQKRIDSLTRDKYDAERDAAYWKEVAESKPAPAPAPELKQPEELDPHDFDSDADYLKAVAEQVRSDIRGEIAGERAATQASETQRTAMNEYSKGRAKYADFDKVALSKSLPINQDMFDAAMGENMSEILYHLGKNPAEAARISSLPKIQQIKEIGRIESAVTANPNPKTITTAPNPPSTIAGGGNPPTKPDGEKTQAELNVEWEQERRGRLGVK